MKCPECGRILPDYAVFCGACGKKIKAGAPAPVKAPTEKTPAYPADVHSRDRKVNNDLKEAFYQREETAKRSPGTADIPPATGHPASPWAERPAPARTETPPPAWTDYPAPTRTERPVPARTETPPPAWMDNPSPARTDRPVPARAETPAPAWTDYPAPEKESFPAQEEAAPDWRTAGFPESGVEVSFESENTENNKSSDKSAEKAAGKIDNLRERVSKARMPDHLRRISSADKSGGGLEKFYIADFLMRLFGVKENLPLCLYLVMNVFLIGLIATMFTGGNVIVGMLAGLVLYILSMTIALSPWGERLLRSRTGFVPIEDPETAARIMPIFEEVKARAKKVNPNMPDDISLFINDDEAPNAFATGRRTVCMTRGMLAMSDDQIRGALGHEFGHLSHRDTDRILVITIGNAFVTLFCVFMQICAFLTEGLIHIVAIFMGEDGFFVALLGSLSRIITVKSVSFFLWAWTGVGALLCMKTSRGNEYQADEFSYRLGYGRGLISVLGALGGGAKPDGLFATLAASHPPMNDRIARLEHLLAGGHAGESGV